MTRVVPVGEPTAEMRDRFTRVLKGHIALATAVFPEGTNGGQLDSFARRPLWEAGLDFAHGTGHGVGAYLSVHEGPQRIAKPNYPGGGPAEPLRAGMIISNEPGYYKAGEYGIRIENLVLVDDARSPGAEQPMLGFETLTFAPIERALIEPALLTATSARGWTPTMRRPTRCWRRSLPGPIWNGSTSSARRCDRACRIVDVRVMFQHQVAKETGDDRLRYAGHQ